MFTFWRNLWLRGPMIVDPTGAVAGGEFAQPSTGLPFGRTFVLTQDQTVELPHFGHDPQRVIDTVRAILDRTRLGFTARPASVAPGEPVAFTAWGGAPGQAVLMAVVEADSNPCWIGMALGSFDARGAFDHLEVAPDDPAFDGMTFGLVAIGFAEHDGRLAVSDEVFVSIDS